MNVFPLTNFEFKSTFMSTESKFESDIASIRTMMERTSKFISLSGLSGVLAGIYALIGAAIAYLMLQYPNSPLSYRTESVQSLDVIIKLLLLAAVVLILSLGSVFWLTSRKAKRLGANVWDRSARLLLINLATPIFAGGIFILILLANGHYGVVAPACLVFYGLGLINASPNLYDEIRYLGYSEIVLGLLSAALPGYGLLFWSIGFGILHIVYGVLMHRKYDK